MNARSEQQTFDRTRTPAHNGAPYYVERNQ